VRVSTHQSRYKWTVSNGALPVPSLLTQAVSPVKPFLSIPPHVIHERIRADQFESCAARVVIQEDDRGEQYLNVTSPPDKNRQYWNPGYVPYLVM
jgi:hypothetical protein